MTKREASENISLFDDDELLDLPLKTHPANNPADGAATSRNETSARAREVQVEAAGPLETLPAIESEQAPAPLPPSGEGSAAQVLENLELFDATVQPAGEAGRVVLRGADAERAVFGDRTGAGDSRYLRADGPVVEEKMAGARRLAAGILARRLTVFHRLLAGALDAAIHVGVALFAFLLVVGEAMPEDRRLLPGFAVFLVVFSFLYFVLSLLAWGRTPGMVWAGIESCDKDGRGLTFGQAVLRWLGVMMTVGLLGLPFLLALLGRSAADILSGTVTRFSESR